MLFGVNLIEVPPLADLSGVDVFDLMTNCTHVAGPYWIFEGDPDFLAAPHRLVAQAAGITLLGVTEGTGGMGEEELVRHASEIFDFRLSGQPAAFEMLNEEGRS